MLLLLLWYVLVCVFVSTRHARTHVRTHARTVTHSLARTHAPPSPPKHTCTRTQCVHEAKQREHMRRLHEIYGRNRLTMLRAKSFEVFHSNTFQFLVCGLILVGFVIDMIEAQAPSEPLPPPLTIPPSFGLLLKMHLDIVQRYVRKIFD